MIAGMRSPRQVHEHWEAQSNATRPEGRLPTPSARELKCRELLAAAVHWGMATYTPGAGPDSIKATPGMSIGVEITPPNDFRDDYTGVDLYTLTFNTAFDPRTRVTRIPILPSGPRLISKANTARGSSHVPGILAWTIMGSMSTPPIVFCMGCTSRRSRAPIWSRPP